MNKTSDLVAVLLCLTGLSLGGCQKWQKAHDERAARRRQMDEARAAKATTPLEASEAAARAQILEKQGLDDIAMAEFEKAIAINPKLTTAYMGVGDIHRKHGDLAKAEVAYHQAAEVEPTSFDAQYNDGLMLQLLNRIAEAVRAYIRALSIQPDDYNANLNLATAYFQLGEPGPALPYAQRAVKLKGDSGPARVNLGAIYAALGNNDAAVIEYQQAAELMELSPELLLNLADALGKVGRYAEMQNTLEQLVKTKPSAAAYERLATSLFRQQKFDDSLGAFRKALEYDANYYPALNGVGVNLLNKYLLSDKKDLASHDEALKALRRSLQIEPKQPAVVDLVTRYG